MKIINQSRISFVFIFLVAKLIIANDTNFLTYCNSRFGFCVKYPNNFIMDPPPFNDDGRIFRDNSGFNMTVSGINNALENSMKDEMDEQIKDFDVVTYKAKGKNWFVLSGYKGEKILYRKTFVGKGALNHLFIEYPAKENNKYNKIVSKIAQSFKPGDLNEIAGF